MSYSAVNEQERVVLGKLGKTHGVKGWLKLHSYTTPPENILEYPNLHIDLGDRQRMLLVDECRQQNENMLVHFEGFDDPESARELTGVEVWIRASDLPELETGDYYWHELVGLLVVNEQGLLFGRVSKLLETGANDVLVVAATSDSIDERERLIPYVKGTVVKQVDKTAGRILVEWDASYLD